MLTFLILLVTAKNLTLEPALRKFGEGTSDVKIQAVNLSSFGVSAHLDASVVLHFAFLELQVLINEG